MPKTGADLPILIGQAGPLNGERWMLERALTIGRDEGCDVVVPDRQVSRFHARLTPEDQGVLLEDLAAKTAPFTRAKGWRSRFISRTAA
jgi:pSer/pThr/pTyr-binding forkhead associated (FHA) protein